MFITRTDISVDKFDRHYTIPRVSHDGDLTEPQLILHTIMARHRLEMMVTSENNN